MGVGRRTGGVTRALLASEVAPRGAVRRTWGNGNES